MKKIELDFDTMWEARGRAWRFGRAIKESQAIGASILAGDTDRGYYTLDFRRQPERYVADEPVPLKEGYQFLCRQVNGEGYWYVVLNPRGAVVASGITDDSGRGGPGFNCVYDSWGYHDTCLEEFRADVDHEEKEEIK